MRKREREKAGCGLIRAWLIAYAGNGIIWTWSLSSGCPHFIIAFKRPVGTNESIKSSTLLKDSLQDSQFPPHRRNVQGSQSFLEAQHASYVTSPNSGNANGLQTTLWEGRPCGCRRHLVCAGNGTSPAANPAVMETGAVARLQKLPKKKKSPLTSGHLSRI